MGEGLSAGINGLPGARTHGDGPLRRQAPLGASRGARSRAACSHGEFACALPKGHSPMQVRKSEGDIEKTCISLGLPQERE